MSKDTCFVPLLEDFGRRAEVPTLAIFQEMLVRAPYPAPKATDWRREVEPDIEETICLPCLKVAPSMGTARESVASREADIRANAPSAIRGTTIS